MACAQAFIDIGNSLMTVAVFAGAISFGALITLPIDAFNGPYVRKLLAIAANIFTISMFVAMGIPYILRKETLRKAQLPFYKSLLCQIHVWLVVGLLMAGFMVLNILLINIEEKQIGYVGITLLGLIPLWYLSLSFLEINGVLDHGLSVDLSSTQVDRSVVYSEDRSSY